MGQLKDELSKKIERQEEQDANRIAHSLESPLLDHNIICIHSENVDLSSLECTDDDDIECLEYVRGLTEINISDSAITQPHDGVSICNLPNVNDGIANPQVSFAASESAFKDIVLNAIDVAAQIESTNEALATTIESIF